jgi:UDP-N-acetyl-2-amino-2-deoxyglucuronate dehydrogenase
MAAAYRVAVIGTGGISRWHANYFVKIEGVELVAACDISAERLRKFSEEYGLTACYLDHHQLLEAEKPDIVCIATWHATHAPLTIDAARAGVRGILCEKPMGINMRSVREMVQVCEERGVKLAIHHQSRFQPHYTEMRRLIAAGAIGEPQHVTWRTGGGLLNNASHGIDLTRYLLGDPNWELVVGQVGRRTNRYERGVPIEDFAAGLVRFEGGCELALEVDFEGEKSDPVHYLVGTEGLIRYGGSEALLLNAQTGGWQPIRGEPQPDPATELIAWMEGGPPHRNAGRVAMVAQEIMMALYESAHSHTLVRPPLEVEESPLFQMMASGHLPEPEGERYDIRSNEALEYALTGKITPKPGQDEAPRWIAPPS